MKLLDKWSLVHFAAWFALFPGMGLFHVPTWARWLITVAGIVAWELVEWGLERRGAIRSNEGWVNRWVSDPIVGLAGALVGGAVVG